VFDTALNRLTAVFQGADQDVFTLPDEVVQARRTLAALDAAVVELPDPAVAQDKLLHNILDAARSNAPMPDARAVIKLREQRQAAEELAARLAEAREIASRELVTLTWDLGDTIVTEHLRPAFDDVLRAARAAAEDTGNTSDDETALLHMGEKQRAAWAALDALASRYAAIRNAQRQLQEGQVQKDTDGLLAEVRNLKQLWPAAGTNMARRPPWPTHSQRARLRWLVTSGAELWMPTAAERDSLWAERYDEIAKRVRQAQMIRDSDGAYVPL
jgi:hypothetical protein